MSWTNLEDKVVIVTGGAAGIGLAIAKGFVEVGAKVMIADFAEDVGARAVDEVNQLGSGEAAFIRCDVTSKADVDNLIEKTIERWGSVDALVNNAGINVPRLLVDPAGKEELTEEIWDKVFAVNVKGQFLCAQAAARQMLASGKGGVIINMSSESGMEGSEGQSVYAATKAAVINLTQNLAREWAPQNVRVNALSPGFFPAEQNKKVLTPDRIESIMRHTPADRFGSPEELAGAILLMASPTAGSFLTGENIVVDGGFMAMTI